MNDPLDNADGGAVWRPFGLADDPFFTAPLRSLKSVPRGIHLFRGEARERDALKIVQRILNSSNSVKLIEGPSGTGKTTLANYVKFKLSGRPDTVVGPDPIQIDPSNASPERFAAEALYAAVVAFRSSEALGEVKRGVEKEAGGRVLDQMISKRSKDFSLSQIVGVTWTRSWMMREASERPLGDWRDALVRVHEVGAADGVDHIVLHINNLDQATQTDAKRVGDLFGQIRDLLQLDGFHFILCGNPAFRLRALEGRPGVTDILGTPTEPAPLSSKEAAAIIEARYEDLRIHRASFVPPIPPDEFVKLYELFDGEIRLVFGMLSETIAGEIGPSSTPQGLTASAVLEIQRPILEQLVADLDERQVRVLSAIAQLSEDGAKDVRQADVVAHFKGARAKGLSQGYISQIADDLASMRWIVKRQPNQRATFYNLSGRSKVVRRSLSRKP